VARPTKYDGDTVLTLLEMIARGKSYQEACRVVGIHYDTFRVWCRTKPQFAWAVGWAETAPLVQTALRRVPSTTVGGALRSELLPSTPVG
jgi:hypothetical protein